MLGLILLLVYLNKVTLLGNSLGGAVALGYALAYPNEVGRLILMAPGGVEDLQTYLDMPGIANMFKIYQSGKTGAQAMRSVMSMQLFDPSLLTDEIIAERAPIAAIQTQAARSVMKIPNMTERLKELQCPIFGFWGVNDQFNPLGGALKIVENAPWARMQLVNRCGYWVQVEHRDLFNRTCLNFLKARFTANIKTQSAHLPRHAANSTSPWCPAQLLEGLPVGLFVGAAIPGWWCLGWCRSRRWLGGAGFAGRWRGTAGWR